MNMETFDTETKHNAKEIESLCENLTSELAGLFPNIEVHFLPHRQGQHLDRIEKTLARLIVHPAYNDAKQLLKSKGSTHGNSAFLGIAVGFERGPFGLTHTERSLAFISLNLDQHPTKEDLLFFLYHLVGQFMHLAANLEQVDRREKAGHILQPRKNNLAIAFANLRADAFSALMMTASGYDHAVRDLVKHRSLQALTAQTTLRPEEFPFAIALDVAQFAAESFSPGKRTLLNSAFQTSKHIAKSFDRDNLETWINFALPSQVMAWNNAPPEQILGSAINTSPSPFIKATGLLIAEVTKIFPLAAESLPGGYNPFVDMEINQINHERHVEEIFQMVMIHAAEADTHLPLVRVANNQNEALLKGRMMGWCAHALQAAAQAYESAAERGIPPAQAARLEFQSAQKLIGWNHLHHLGHHIVDRQRSGEKVSLTTVSNWCEKRGADLRCVAESIHKTIEDPTFGRKLSVAENSVPMPEPSMTLPSESASPTARHPPPTPSAARPPHPFGENIPAMRLDDD